MRFGERVSDQRSEVPEICSLRTRNLAKRVVRLLCPIPRLCQSSIFTLASQFSAECSDCSFRIRPLADCFRYGSFDSDIFGGIPQYGFEGEKEKRGGASLPLLPDLTIGPCDRLGILTSRRLAALLGTEPHSEAALVSGCSCTSPPHSENFPHTLVALLRTRCGLSIP